MDISKVAVIGGGTMGNGIAHVFALNDLPVTLIEVSEELGNRAKAEIENNLDRMVKKEKINSAQKMSTLDNITLSTTIEEGVADVDLAIEAVPEKFELKKSIFQQLDDAAPNHAILATNTSSISITKLASQTTRAGNVIGMHFFNPVPVMKLVEIVKGQLTSEDTYNSVEKTARLLDKTPVPVNDYPGFVSNRVLMPMINEAIFAVHEGVASPKAVDSVMKLGMAHPMGPLRLADFIGLDVCLDILNVLYEGFKDPKYRPCPLLVKKVEAGKLGNKTGEGFYSYTD